MAPETATHDRIYRAVKAAMVESHVAPGGRLNIQAIADRCAASVTPVREVLYRLVGEELVEAHPDGGFRFATLDFQRLANLYSWTAQHLLSALHITSGSSVREAMVRIEELQRNRSVIDVAAVTSETFEALARATGNDEYVAAIQRANFRLHYSRLAEAKLFGDLEKELRTFFRNGTIDVKTNVRRRVIAYHRRRVEHAAQLSALIRQSI